MHEKYMKLALEQSIKAWQNNDVPIGAVIVENNKVISRAYNMKDITKIATKHAEIIAIEKACRKKKDWRLTNCTIYTTLEPCPMCINAIVEARISKIVYGASSNDVNNIHYIEHMINIGNSTRKVEVIGNVLEQECSKLIREFFLNKR